MDCRQFRKQHSYFIDDMLSGVATWAMRDHLTTCAACSKFDTQLRRSLLIARQARTLEPSGDFQRKLSARLAAEKLARPAFREMSPPPQSRRIPLIAAAVAALAAGVTGLGLIAPNVSAPAPARAEIVAGPVATAEPGTIKSPPTPLAQEQPVHSAMLLAQRATEQFAASQARAAGTRPTH
jgi:hypothetical protein